MAPCGFPSTALSDPGCLVGVVPPHVRKCGYAVFGQRLGMAEAIPARIALESVVEMRNAVDVPEQYPVHRLAGRDLFGAVLGEDDPLDQRVHRSVLDPAHIAGTGLVGGL